MKYLQLHTLKIIGFFLIISLMSACHKDKLTESKHTTPLPSPVILKETIGDIIGYVYDESSQPIEGVTISIYNSETTTDKYGVYRFKQVKLDKLGTYIKAQKNGYILGSDYVYPLDGTLYSYIHLYTKDNLGSFNAVTGGTVSVQGGGKLNFSPKSIVDLAGNIYSDKVLVTAKRLATDDLKLADKMPGSLRGEADNGNSVVLGTYGMLVVELSDIAGNELQIKEGSFAQVEFPLTNALRDIAPNEIPLWYFDEVVGIWEEEGKAVLVGDHYEGKVHHFTWWNLDVSFSIIKLSIFVKRNDGKPIPYHSVKIVAEGIGVSNGWTNESGMICGFVPKSKKLTLIVSDPLCNEALASIDV